MVQAGVLRLMEFQKRGAASEAALFNGQVVLDREKGELRILGIRRTAINAQAICDHLDTLVGVQVSEVIMHNLEFRLGKLEGARIRLESPQTNLRTR